MKYSGEPVKLVFMPISRRVLLIGIFLSALVAAGFYLSNRREWIQNQLLDALVARFAPHLPFEIDSYRLSRNLDHFEARLHRGAIVVTLSGPVKALDIGGEAGWEIDYRPDVEVVGWARGRLIAQIGIRGRKLTGLKVALDPASAPKLSLTPLGLEITEPRLEVEAIPGESYETKVDFAARSVTWTDPAHNQHAVSAEHLELHAQHGLEHTSAQLSAKTGELLWDDFYRELPLSHVPIGLTAQNLRQAGDPFELTIGLPSHPQLHSTVRPGVDATWSVSRLPVEPVLRWAIPSIGESLELKGGALTTAGRVSLSAKVGGTARIESAQATLEGLALRSEKASYAATGVRAQVTYDRHRAVQKGTLSAKRIDYRHFTGGLSPLAIEWAPEFARFDRTLPLRVEGVPLSIGPTSVVFKPELKVTSSLQLGRTPLPVIAKGFCQPLDKTPPGEATAQFTRVEAGSGYIDPTGQATVDLFGGRIQLNEIGVYDLDTDVPETDFDAEWSGIDLQSLSAWLRFGEILGTLEGHAHEVVFQSTLPTHYLFEMQAKPLSGENFVEFSPDAMKNVVKLFTGENLDEQIPGIAGWLMFGWPSRVFGGYDVHYAGIKATSENGTIVVETLDPEKVVRETRKHFVLYGPRFKMPLKSIQYPVLIDATAMANFVHQLTRTLKSIQEAKGESANEPPEIVCNPPAI
jgi:hypothetical protein